MKKHLSSLLFGSLGLCVGFTLCYVYLVLPERTAKASAPQWAAFPVQTAAFPPQARGQLEWRPYLIQPMIPPKIVGK